jgi:hypothetical protein
MTFWNNILFAIDRKFQESDRTVRVEVLIEKIARLIFSLRIDSIRHANLTQTNRFTKEYHQL